MAEKISTIILKVDLDCHLCYKKIRKTLCKLQERENIQLISYDEKNNTVTISGPFDPQKLSKKLCCKACKVIKDIQIVEKKEKEKEKPKDTKPAEPAKEKPKDTKPAEPAKEKPKDPKPAEPAKEKPKDPKPQAEPAKEKPKDPKPQAEPAKEKPKAAEPAKSEKEKPKAEPVGVVQWPEPSYPPGWAGGPVCGCGPWYAAQYGGCRCGACGRTYGWVTGGPPYDVGKGQMCHFFSEEDPSSASCTVM